MRASRFLRIFAAACLLAAASLAASASRAKAESGGAVSRLLEGVRTGAIAHRDQFLEALPARAKRRFTLLKRSRSPDRRCVSRRYPRAIVASREDGLAIVFNGNPAPGCQDVDVVSFEDRGGQRRSAAIPKRISVAPDGAIIGLVDDPNAPGIDVEKRCATCHGEDWSPIWPAYRVWEDAFGALDDVESGGFAELRALWMADDSPYRFLDWSEAKGDPYYPYSSSPFDQGAPDRRPNLRLTFHLGADFAAGRAARLIEATPAYERGKWELFRAALCGPGRVADSFRTVGVDVHALAPRPGPARQYSRDAWPRSRKPTVEESMRGEGSEYNAGMGISPGGFSHLVLLRLLERYPEILARGTRPSFADYDPGYVRSFRQKVDLGADEYPRELVPADGDCRGVKEAIRLSRERELGTERAPPYRMDYDLPSWLATWPPSLPVRWAADGAATGDRAAVLFRDRCGGKCHGGDLSVLRSPRASELLESGKMPKGGIPLTRAEIDELLAGTPPASEASAAR